MSFNIDESPFFDLAADYAKRLVLKGIRPVEKEDICSWTESNVDLSFDHTGSATGLVRLYPYQREILRACDDAEVQEVTIQAGQRLGKSSCWKYALLKRVHDGGLSSLIVYPSLDLAERTNRDTVIPLLQTLPEAARDLSSRGNKLKSSFHIPSQNSVIYFIGGGSQVISSTANFCVLDESDFIELQNADDEQKNISQIKALRLRMQSFKQRMMIVCSSPTQFGGVVHVNYKRSSMGEWHVRCLHCGELSPVNKLAFFLDGDRWAGLQWKKDDSGNVIEDSIRWICPHCLHEHTYLDAIAMNEQGQYVHQRPNNTLHRGFQIGALANPYLWTWREIAQAQEDAINGEARKYLANTITGMPYKHVAENDTSVSVEEANRKRQIEYPADLKDKLSVVLMALDQQKSELAGAKYYVCVTRGFDEQGNSYLLSCSTENSLDGVQEKLNAVYFGHKVDLCICDQGGFNNEDDLDQFIRRNPRAYYYKGTSGKNLDGRSYVLSQNEKKLFLCDALKYQVKLLDLMYSPKRPSGYNWYLPLNVDETYFQQICSVKPNGRMAKDGNGYVYANWACFSGRRDYFDCEKEILAALDIMGDYYPANAYSHGRMPMFLAKEKIIALARKKKLHRA